jgi:ABC-type Fe3+/spermidine/putrescine transport system ATPase subunit
VWRRTRHHASAAERRNFGMVFQGYALFPNLSVADNIGFPLTVRRMASAEGTEGQGCARWCSSRAWAIISKQLSGGNSSVLAGPSAGV